MSPGVSGLSRYEPISWCFVTDLYLHSRTGAPGISCLHWSASPLSWTPVGWLPVRLSWVAPDQFTRAAETTLQRGDDLPNNESCPIGALVAESQQPVEKDSLALKSPSRGCAVLPATNEPNLISFDCIAHREADFIRPPNERKLFCVGGIVNRILQGARLKLNHSLFLPCGTGFARHGPCP